MVRNSRASWRTCSTTPPFDITTLSRDPEGDQYDGLSSGLDRLDTFRVDGQTLELQLERVELKPGFHVWLVSADSIGMIPKAHQIVAETPFEKKLPQQLVTFEIFDTPVWRWIALVTMGLALWILMGFLSWALVAVVRPLVKAAAFFAVLCALLWRWQAFERRWKLRRHPYCLGCTSTARWC